MCSIFCIHTYYLHGLADMYACIRTIAWCLLETSQSCLVIEFDVLWYWFLQIMANTFGAPGTQPVMSTSSAQQVSFTSLSAIINSESEDSIHVLDWPVLSPCHRLLSRSITCSDASIFWALLRHESGWKTYHMSSPSYFWPVVMAHLAWTCTGHKWPGWPPNSKLLSRYITAQCTWPVYGPPIFKWEDLHMSHNYLFWLNIYCIFYITPLLSQTFKRPFEGSLSSRARIRDHFSRFLQFKKNFGL